MECKKSFALLQRWYRYILISMKRISVYLALAVVVLLPQAANGFSGAGEVTRLANNVFMYSETVTLTADEDALSVPIRAVPQMQPGIGSDILKYRTLLDGRAWAGLETYAAVVSQTPIENFRYVLPPGETAEFMLVALLVLPDQEPIKPDLEVGFDVTSFPVKENR